MAAKKRRKKRNPSSWGEAIGALVSFIPPTVAFMAGKAAERDALDGARTVAATSGVVLTGAVLGSTFAVFNGVEKPSFSRGYAAGSLAQLVVGVVGAVLSKPAALPPKVQSAAVEQA